jgi:hypothetical protein
VPDGRLERLPERGRGQPDGDDREQHGADGMLPQQRERADLVAFGRWTAERDPHRDPGQHEVGQAEADEAQPRQRLQRVAVFGHARGALDIPDRRHTVVIPAAGVRQTVHVSRAAARSAMASM